MVEGSWLVGKRLFKKKEDEGCKKRKTRDKNEIERKKMTGKWNGQVVVAFTTETRQKKTGWGLSWLHVIVAM